MIKILALYNKIEKKIGKFQKAFKTFLLFQIKTTTKKTI